MSQLNLKQILSGDDISSVVEKVNYNFDQIILNGGGPMGLRGILGAPGLIGQQGEIGATGPIGEDGTHLYTDQLTPSLYPFGTGGEILPRIDDVFIEAQSSYISIWQYSATGSTGAYWNLIDTLVAPNSGFSTIVYDYVTGPSATTNRITNDPSITGKFLFGTPDALYGTAASGSTFSGLTIIDPNYDPITSGGVVKLVQELSDGYPGIEFDSMMLLASSRNQIRLVTIDTDNSTRFSKGGGVIQSLEVNPDGQMFSIFNADFSGDKHFGLSLNTGRTLKTSIYGDSDNRIGIGVDYYVALNATLTVQNTLAVGDSTAFTLASAGATFSNLSGAIIEGNLAVGRNRNTLATGGFYNKSGSFGASVIIDTDGSGAITSAVTELYFGKNMYAKGLIPTLTRSDWFRFRHDSVSTSSNYRKFRLTGHYEELSFSTIVSKERDLITAKLYYPFIVAAPFGSVGIDNNDASSTFEVGMQEQPASRISMGNAPSAILSGYMTSYLGFNLLRKPSNTNGVNDWIRRGDGVSNGGKTFWTHPNGGLGLSFFPSTSGATATGISDQNVYQKTRVNWSTLGQYSMSQFNIATEIYLDTALALDWGGTGSTGYDNTNLGFRRKVAALGNGISTGEKGSPLIFAHNGLRQDAAREATVGFTVDTDFGPISPQYAFIGNEIDGLFLANGSSANGGSYTGSAVGIAAMGSAMIYAQGDTQRIGLFTRNPHERVQIGDRLVIHDGGSKFFGYNRYYDGVGIKQMHGTTAPGGTQQGNACIGFTDIGATEAQENALTRWTVLGTSIFSIAKNIGVTGSYISDSNITATATYPANTYAGTRLTPAMSPPKTLGVTQSGWYNLAPVTPQFSIGLANDFDSSLSGNRGTLNVTSQMRIKPATSANPPTGPFGLTIEDQYNIGLYSFDAYPVSAIHVSGGNSVTGNFKNFGINFIGTGGNAINEDISILHASSTNSLINRYERIANFGVGFRLGVNIVPSTQSAPLISGHYDLASLTVGGYGENVPSDVMQAALFKGSVVIDQSVNSGGDGGNQGLVFKDNSIVTTYKPTRPNIKDYYGDWGIHYYKVNDDQAGLNFWIPGKSSNILYLDDTGGVGIGTTTFIYNTPVNNGYHVPTNASWTNWSNGTVKLAVAGGIQSTYSLNTSDRRVKDNINALETTLEKIMKLKPVSFNMKDSPGIMFGFIAQDIQEVYPEVVRVFNDKELEGGRLTLDYNSIIAVLAKGMQEQQADIETKNKRIKNLEAKLSKIEELLIKNNII
jgi:hypothetical protein